MKTIKLTKSEFLEKVANYETSPKEWKYLGDKPAIVDFYASWCGHCQALAPVLEDLAGEFTDKIIIYKVDAEEEEELADVFGVESYPTLLFIPLAGEARIEAGVMAKEELIEAINNVLLKL